MHDALLLLLDTWGLREWLAVGLTAAAVAIGVYAWIQMRPPPLTGTLLYVREDLAGAVGRVDLRPAGRRAASVSADAHGRLALDGEGETIARVVPTRVGGMLEVPREEARPERRLLVDGLALEIAAWRLRYVSGQPSEEPAPPRADVPDLLGPEFDIERGRIEGLEDDG